jgi:hypothetical protein
LGATVLGIFTVGWIGVFAGPVLAIFGWFYLVPVAVLVAIAMAIAEGFRGGFGSCLFVLAGGMTDGIFMAVYGVREVGSVRYTIAYAIGGGLSGATVAILIVWRRRLWNSEQAETAPPLMQRPYEKGEGSSSESSDSSPNTNYEAE